MTPEGRVKAEVLKPRKSGANIRNLREEIKQWPFAR
jgi:hypothetical protein